ncbi:hypothetical protein GCM10009715_03320 [Paeniglutamicibacter psychrophenolicus]|uniref:Uncharacterized protein n=1 Tax=Paeniglutamicibacter psychrophenolicus TaxID=257454 RepID=A0ABS4WBP4_9MICC|nr:hypothetical protein [Paeniglutamicibacter psychrophenolicus]MBP2373343.1 hypothetical protein [Paeniglutamicibacter psychrophenolicus]
MSKGGKVTLAAALAVGLVIGGIYAGMAMADPTASEEYATAVSHAQVAGADRDKYRGELAELTTKHDTLASELADRESALEERESAVGEKETEVSEAEAAVKTREKAVGTAEAEAAANTVSDGMWTVGEDIKPGTYRTTGSVGSRCYWGIYRSGSNGDDIIDNDIPGGGKPTVRLSKGQDFKSSNCGDWRKK